VLAFLSPADLSATPGWDTPAFLFPDWSLVAWPELRDYPPWQRLAWDVDALEAATPWAAKDARLLWRGTTRTNARRGDLLEAAKALPAARVDVVGLPVGWYYLKNLTQQLHVPPAEWCRYRCCWVGGTPLSVVFFCARLCSATTNLQATNTQHKNRNTTHNPVFLELYIIPKKTPPPKKQGTWRTPRAAPGACASTTWRCAAASSSRTTCSGARSCRR
jgi:hypothetical protein